MTAAQAAPTWTGNTGQWQRTDGVYDLWWSSGRPTARLWCNRADDDERGSTAREVVDDGEWIGPVAAPSTAPDPKQRGAR